MKSFPKRSGHTFVIGKMPRRKMNNKSVSKASASDLYVLAFTLPPTGPFFCQTAQEGPRPCAWADNCRNSFCVLSILRQLYLVIIRLYKGLFVKYMDDLELDCSTFVASKVEMGFMFSHIGKCTLNSHCFSAFPIYMSDKDVPVWNISCCPTEPHFFGGAR